MDGIQQLSIQLIHALQTFSPALDTLMDAISFLGRTEFYLVFIPFIYWALDASLGLRMLLMLVSVNFTNSTVKVLLHQPRPYWLGEVKALSDEPTYGLPSSHASDSLGFWGYLAYRMKKDWLNWLVAAIVVLVGISRLYLGMHFIHDVLLGWIVGAAVLLTFTRYEGKVAGWLNKRSLASNVGFAFGISLGMIAIALLARAAINGVADPAAWSEFAALSRSPNYGFSLGGVFFGGLSGYFLMKKHANFDEGGTRAKRVGRYLVGVIGVVVLFFGLDKAFSAIAADETVLGYVLRYIRYGTVGLWVTFIAPWIFLKLKLAAPVKKKR